MLITLNETAFKKQEITPPLFWVDPNRVEIRTLLDKNTYAEAFRIKGYSSCRTVNADICSSQIASAYQHWLPITEQEFFDFYYKVHNSLSLKPELCVKS
jgi:hypothetical protein